MLVADDKLDEMATIEFVPPKGLQPWEGAVLLDEKLDDKTVQLWLSGLAGREAIEIDDNTKKVAIGSGRRRGELDATDAALLDGLIGTDGPYQTGKYDPVFAKAWKGVAGELNTGDNDLTQPVSRCSVRSVCLHAQFRPRAIKLPSDFSPTY